MGAVRVDESLLDYVMSIVQATRRSEFLVIGASPRGSLALRRAAQALAYFEGRDYCIPDDIKRLALPVLAHRVIVSSKYSSPKLMTTSPVLASDIPEVSKINLIFSTICFALFSNTSFFFSISFLVF